MITLREALNIHSILIDSFGEKKGLRDKAALEAALNRPYQTFEKQDLYPTPVHKAAALLESIVINHPFIDGNKRIGYVLMRLTLLQSGMDIEAGQEEKYNFVISVAKGEMSASQITDWLRERVKPSAP